MRAREFLLALLVIASSLSPSHASPDLGGRGEAPPQDGPAGGARVVRVSAERFAFTPSEIVVDRGTAVEFHLTSEDTDHGFRIVGTSVDVAIPKRRRGEAVVHYTADTPGRFVIECSRPCGAGHTAMRAVLVVK